jgi:hypothetical protein
VRGVKKAFEDWYQKADVHPQGWDKREHAYLQTCLTKAFLAGIRAAERALVEKEGPSDER